MRAPAQRLLDMKGSIVIMRDLLRGKSLEDLHTDHVTRLAFERCIEIISEASRHIPEAMKAPHGAIPWRHVADVGNVLRHAYHGTSTKALWAIYTDDLAPLEAAVDAMLAALPDQKDP